MNVLRRLIPTFVVFVIGCQSHRPNPPLPAPTTQFSTDYFQGTPLSAALTGTVSATQPTDAATLHVTFIALEKVPATPFQPIGSRAVFFSSIGGGNAVLPAAELTRNATIADLHFPEDLPATLRDGQAGRMTTMTKLPGALPPDIVGDFAALDPITLTDPVTGKPTHRSVEVLVSRSQVALVVKDFSAWQDGKFGLRTEKAICDLPAGDYTNTALVVPFQFDNAASKAIAILIQISPGTDDAAHAAATTDCLKHVAMHLATTQPNLSTGQINTNSAITTAIQSLSTVANRRASLTFLTEQTGAAICEDLALEGDDALLAALVQDVQQKAKSQPDIGWLLDLSALESLAKLSSDAANGTAKMPAELAAILATNTGEVGRHTSSMNELLKGLNNRQELDNRLLAQNTIFLEDSSPASRVRAYDWLNARHHAPAGYDPLAPGKQRREALERAAGTP